MECKLFKQCGSCHYINQDYSLQLEHKKEYCKQLIQKAHLPINVASITGQQIPYNYRNKVIIGFNAKGEPGFYEENSHKIVPYKGCLLDDQLCDEIILFITSLFKKYRIVIYNQDKRTGFLRHLLLRCGKESKEYMVTLVATSLIFPGSKNFISELIQKYPMIKTVVINENKRQTSIVLGDKSKVLYGKGYIQDTLCGLKFSISSNSFYQINHEQCEALYTKGLSLLNLKKEDYLIDTYCGIGTIGMIAAKQCKEVLGIELNKQATKDAINNARINHIENIQFLNGDSTKCMEELAKQNITVDALVMDPPRDGSTERFIKAVNDLKVKKVLYISCNPETQVRDLKVFKTLNYHLSNMHLVDMFPHTKSIESIVILTKDFNENKQRKYKK